MSEKHRSDPTRSDQHTCDISLGTRIEDTGWSYADANDLSVRGMTELGGTKGHSQIQEGTEIKQDQQDHQDYQRRRIRPATSQLVHMHSRCTFYGFLNFIPIYPIPS